jgi:hypothetical protein
METKKFDVPLDKQLVSACLAHAFGIPLADTSNGSSSSPRTQQQHRQTRGNHLETRPRYPEQQVDSRQQQLSQKGMPANMGLAGGQYGLGPTEADNQGIYGLYGPAYGQGGPYMPYGVPYLQQPPYQQLYGYDPREAAMSMGMAQFQGKNSASDLSAEYPLRSGAPFTQPCPWPLFWEALAGPLLSACLVAIPGPGVYQGYTAQPAAPPEQQPQAHAKHERPAAGDEDAGDDAGARALKRPRLVWTPQLHQCFVEAVNTLTLKNAVPKAIMQVRPPASACAGGMWGRNSPRAMRVCLPACHWTVFHFVAGQFGNEE